MKTVITLETTKEEAERIAKFFVKESKIVLFCQEFNVEKIELQYPVDAIYQDKDIPLTDAECDILDKSEKSIDK